MYLSEQHRGHGPFGAYGTQVAVWLEGEDGSVSRVGLPDCNHGLEVRRVPGDVEHPRNSDSWATAVFGGETWELELDLLWDQREDVATGDLFLPELKGGERYVVVARWTDRQSGRWAKRVFRGVTLRADSWVAGDGDVFHYRIPLRAGVAEAVTTGSGAAPDPLPTAVGEIRVRSVAGAVTRLYSHNGLTYGLSATSSVPDLGEVESGGVSEDGNADWWIRLGALSIPIIEGEGLETPDGDLLVLDSSVLLWCRDAVMHLRPGAESDFTGVAGFAGGEDAVEFVTAAGAVVLVVTASGVVYAAELTESEEQPVGVEEAMHFVNEDNGEWQFTVSPAGLVVRELEETEVAP